LQAEHFEDQQKTIRIDQQLRKVMELHHI
jgi:hypothetical protein